MAENGRDGEIIMEMDCFYFRVIDMPDGNQVIDQTLRTPYEALTPLQMTEYAAVADQIAYMEMLKRRAQREAEQRRKNSRSILYKAACLFGLA